MDESMNEYECQRPTTWKDLAVWIFQVHLNLNRKLITTTKRDSNAKYNLGMIR